MSAHDDTELIVEDELLDVSYIINLKVTLNA